MKSRVYAGKVDPYYNVVTEDSIYLGEIEFNSVKEAFVKTIRLYNKNARRHIYNPQFRFDGRQWYCWEYGSQSKTGRGYTHYWVLTMTVKGKGLALFETGPKGLHDVYVIPKSKVNLRDAVKYIEEW